MITLYNIFNFAQDKNILEELSAEEMAEYIMANPSTTDEYKIIPVQLAQERKKKEKTEKELAALKVSFIRTLNFGQKNDIRLGKKVIKYGEQLGYYLQFVKPENGQENGQSGDSENAFFSPQVEILKRRKKLEKDIFENVSSFREDVYTPEFYKDYSREEFDISFNNVVKLPK